MTVESIRLRGLRVFAYHGVLAEEQSAGQEFAIDVTIHADLATAASSDDLADTIDYGTWAAAIHDRVRSARWNLSEGVAGGVRHVVREVEGVASVEVRVH